MKVIKTILILVHAASADQSCTVDDGTCLLQLRNKVEDLRGAEDEHVNHDAEYWKRRLQLLRMRRSNATKNPPCEGCPQGSDLCEGQERSSSGFGLQGGEDVHMCRHDGSGALCAYPCEPQVLQADTDDDSSDASGVSGSLGSISTSSLIAGGVAKTPSEKTEESGIPQCPGADQHLHITSPQSCEAHGAVMRAADGTNLEDYFWDNVRIKEVKYKVDGETLPTHQQMIEYNFTKRGASESSQNAPHVVEVMVKDVGNFEVACQRNVYVDDASPPTWLHPPPDHSADTLGQHGAHTLEFVDGEDCSRTADELFAWYEDTTGWTSATAAQDNCQDIDGPPSVYREVWRVDYATGEVGALLYSDNSRGVVPETWLETYIGEQIVLLKWYAMDASGKQMESTDVHSVRVHLADNVPPGADDVVCPAKFHVTLLHNESTATVTWEIPKVVSDNCPPMDSNQYPEAVEEARSPKTGFPSLTNQLDEHGHVVGHTGHFEPGIYEVDYSLHDSKGNVFPHECEMIIEVEQYASPVHLECPDEVPAAITSKKNYAPVSWQEPNHNNGLAHQDNNPVDVTYLPEGVVPGIAFPWGTTTITVVATGTGNVSDASHNRAECSFVVNVTDERPPILHGKKYHCRKEDGGAIAKGVEPYRVCRAPKKLIISEHSSYLETGGYSIDHVGEMPVQECCDSEFTNGTILQHHCHYESDLISYCEEGAFQAVTVASTSETSTSTTTTTTTAEATRMEEMEEAQTTPTV